jgi:alkylhydroperoxidase family enzyme
VTDQYELLAAFSRWQQELVAEERWDELEQLAGRFEGLVAGLPEQPPESARAPLEAAERALVANIAQLEARLEAVRRELAALRAGRETRSAYGYGPGSGTVDAQG